MVLTEPDAGSDVGAGRTKAVAAARRHLAHHRRQALHHLGRVRPGRQHRPLRAGPPRGRRPRHQGPVAVHRPEVPRRPRDRRARRAQRRLRHQRRAQDGPQGLDDLRADLRRATQPAVGTLLGDVHDGIAQMFQRHRVRPDDGRHQGDRHAVDRLPQRARLRQGARAGRRPDADDRQDRAARDHHPPPRRPPLADAAEGVRRGPARAGPLHRDASRTWSTRPSGGAERAAEDGRRRPGQPGQRPAAADRQGRRLRARVGAARHRVAADARRLRLPAGLPDRAVRPRRQDRHALRGHDGDPGPGLLLPQDRPGQGPGARPRSSTQIQEFAKDGAGDGALDTERELLGKALEDVQGIVGFMVGDADEVRPAPGGGDVTNLYKVGQNTTPPAAGRRRPRRRLAAAAPGRGRPTALDGRRRAAKDQAFYEGKVAAASLLRRARSCRSSPPSARSPRRPTTP